MAGLFLNVCVHAFIQDILPYSWVHTLLSGSLYDVCIESRTRAAHNMTANTQQH